MTTFHPGDTVRIGNGHVLYDVSEPHWQTCAAEGRVDIWSHKTGKHREVDPRRLALVERGEQGKAADVEAQRAADAVAEQARIERRNDNRPALNRARPPARAGLGTPRPAFVDAESEPLPIRVTAEILPGKVDLSATAGFTNADRATRYALDLVTSGDYSSGDVWLTDGTGRHRITPSTNRER
ncbi:hypothetical protein [Nocardia bovistercoris]|uniref:Uncharacterized protein n=1 Tax=Nocardia bovistercoris TaxID=2785916 RepID=A0A931N4E7_9NOCA|nr:hypothetical protein [Nocardia bovistercoris]MBH0778789.1 hypothetical protein [Nocardia bovistercoris]